MPEYRVWQAAKNRCFNPNDKHYNDYGGRGITMSPEWTDSFETFICDMGRCPQGLELDRVNNDGNYEKSNCEWRTRKRQMRNTRAVHNLTINGETLCLTDWAERMNINRRNLFYRVKNGWDIKDIFNQARPSYPRHVKTPLT